MRKRYLIIALYSSFLLTSPIAQAQSFEQALSDAYSNNPQVQAQRSRLREIDESYVQARSQGLPTSGIEGQLGGTYLDREASSFSPSTSDFGTNNSVGLNISQPLYQGGRVSGLKSQAKSQILASRAELALVEQNTLLDAAGAYLDVLKDQKATEIRRNNVSVLLKQLDANETRFSVGDGTRTDIAQAETRLEQSKKGLAQANATLAASRATFERVIGYQPESLSQPERYTLPATLDEAQTRAQTRNPRIILARHLEDAADAAVDVARSALRPSLFLNGQLQSNESEFSNFQRSSSAAVTAQLRFPLYTGGLNRSRIRASKEARIQRGFETRDQENILNETIAQAWAQLKAAEEILLSSQKQVDSARVAFEGVSLEQSVGTRTALDVLDAEQELLDAQLSVVNAERDVLFLSYQLLALMGEFGSQNLALPGALFDPYENLENISGKRFEEAVPNARISKKDKAPTLALLQSRPQKDVMMIKARDAAFIEIKKENGEVVLSETLKPGESWMANPDDSYHISANNSGALELFIDSELVGPLGREGLALNEVPLTVVISRTQ